MVPLARAGARGPETMIRRAPEHRGEYWLGKGDIEGETGRSGRRRVYVNGVSWISGAGFAAGTAWADAVEAFARKVAPRPKKWRKR